MPDDKPSPDPEEVARYVRHEWANQEAPRMLLREVVDKRVCEFIGVPYDPHGESHVRVIQSYWQFIIRQKAAQEAEEAQLVAFKAARAERRRGILKSVMERAASILTGILIASGLAWVAAKLHIKIPGVSE